MGLGMYYMSTTMLVGGTSGTMMDMVPVPSEGMWPKAEGVWSGVEGRTDSLIGGVARW